MNSKKWIAISFIVLTLAALACNISVNSDSGGDQGVDAVALAKLTLAAEQTAAAANQAPAAQPPAEQPAAPAVPSDTPQPTAIPTITPTSTPDKTTVTVSENTNCRSGPAVYYTLVGFLTVGVETEVIGWDGRGDYYIINAPDNGRECWLWSRYATVVGDTSGLKVYQIPPTPTPTLTPTPSNIWKGTWTIRLDGNNYTTKISQNEHKISGSFTIGTNTLSFNGKTTDDQMAATGSWQSTSGLSGNFRWEMLKSKKQFIGESTISNSSSDIEWCGGRDGAGPPNPCELP